MNLTFCKQININLSYKLIPLIFVDTVLYVHISIYVYMYMNIWIYVYMNVYHLIPVILIGMTWSSQITQNNEFPKSLECLKKTLSYEVDVSMLINIKVFYKLIVLFLMGLARHAHSTWVNFQYLLWHFKKEVKDEVGTS